MADGNFKADHIRQSTGDKDVWLSPGSSMLPHREEYAEFLQAAENIKTVCSGLTAAPTVTNRETESALREQLSSNREHSPVRQNICFAPGGSRGEQQKNVDWVLLQSLKYSNMDPEQGLLFFYDIACQYSVHFQRRIGHQLPIGLDTDFAIGQFHIHGHKENCLFRFSSMFIPQSGVVIGEILESLWANLNAVTPAMRTATLAHQAEMLDNHICDSNHKKALNIVRMLCKRYVLADKRAADAEDTRDEIAERVGARNITAWTDAIVEAENTRYIDLSVMDIYGMSASYEDHLAVPAEDEPLNGEYQWIREAIEVQELQWHILCRAKRALKNGRADEARQITNLQEKISKGISDIALQSRVLGIDGSDIRNVDPPASLTGTEPLPGDALFSNLNDFEPPENDIDVDDEESSDEADVPTVLTATVASPPLAEHPTTASPSHTGAHLHAENIIIPLPSTVPQCAAQLRSHELGLRERQANALLKSLREIIAKNDLVYAYARCRHALTTLKADDTILRKFKELSKADIKSNTYVVNPNQPGSTTLNLSWIWHVGRDDESALAALQESNRVLYLKSCALASRWREELLLVKHAWWETSASRRAAEADRSSPSPHILSAATIIQCLEAWGEQLSESEGEKNIPLYKDPDGVHRPLSVLIVWYVAQATIPITSPPCDQCIEQLDIITQMMSTLEVVTNDRMMSVAAHGQEAAALFDIYEAVIYKEADNADEAKTQQTATELDAEIQRILDDNQPAPEHANRKKAMKAMEDLQWKNHALIDLINKVAWQSLKAIPNRTNATLPSGSEHSGDTLDQAAKIRNAQFPLIYNLQPLTPIEPKDDGSIPHITSANRPHDWLASVFRTPKLSEPLAEMTGFAALDRAQSSLRRSEPTIPCHNSPEYVPSGSDTPKPLIIPVMDVLESDDDSFQSLGGTSSSIVGKKLAIRQASAQPLASSASGSNASLGGQLVMEYEPNKSVATSDDEASLGGESTEDPSSTDKITDDHHASLAASDDEASLGGQSTEDPSSDDEMADDESMEENTPGVDLSRHRQHTPPAEQEAKDDEDAMSLGGYTDDEADNSHAFSMAEMQANISHIPSSPEVGRMGSPVDEVDDAYSEYSDDSDGDVDIPDDVRAYLQTSHTPGFQYILSKYAWPSPEFYRT
ncbi:hypothetical protein BDN71DRAFT_1499024 [Pleurotus eryngii]|uniref:Uncharacterized protein n=1 Tax=Pleurotus eryngii TaxID=5323 RepID=A0A9P6DAB0_PLEER|nr:hypothetical protein BDN71DRAFT_1499024 [Pleurotus eryngii]